MYKPGIIYETELTKFRERVVEATEVFKKIEDINSNLERERGVLDDVCSRPNSELDKRIQSFD